MGVNKTNFNVVDKTDDQIILQGTRTGNRTQSCKCRTNKLCKLGHISSKTGHGMTSNKVNHPSTSSEAGLLTSNSKQDPTTTNRMVISSATITRGRVTISGRTITEVKGDTTGTSRITVTSKDGGKTGEDPRMLGIRDSKIINKI